VFAQLCKNDLEIDLNKGKMLCFIRLLVIMRIGNNVMSLYNTLQCNAGPLVQQQGAHKPIFTLLPTALLHP
jgi:hypothetical protein